MQRKIVRNALLATLFSAALASCASNPVKQKTLILSALQFKCKAEPKVPPIDMTDGELMVYITRLQNAGEDCRDQLAEVKNSLELQDGITITDVLVQDQKPQRWWQR